MKRNHRLTDVCALALAFIASASQLCSQPTAGESAAGLCLAADVVGGRYAVAVTCEDPILLRRDAMALTGTHPERAMSYRKVEQAFVVPEELSPGITPKLSSASLVKLLDAYYRANPDGPRYRILESSYGFHLVPESVRDERGQLVRATTVLDAIITVPREVRTPSDHLQAIGEAVTRASGFKLDASGSMTADLLYAANGVVPTKMTLIRAYSGDEAVKLPYSFPWGVSGVSGREALLSFLDKSATTLTWRLHCNPHPEPAKSLCWLWTEALVATVTGPDGTPERKTLSYDRCVTCPPLGRPFPRRKQ